MNCYFFPVQIRSPSPILGVPRWILMLLIGLLFSPVTATTLFAQSLGDAVGETRKTTRDTAVVRPVYNPVPFPVMLRQVGMGSALGAALGFAAGLAAESVCDDCHASEPGGDTPGLLTGVPVGALLGVWLLGRGSPPPGDLQDTVLGAAVGTAVFVGYAKLLEDQGDGIRWAGVVFPAALAAMGWSRSRPPDVSAAARIGEIPRLTVEVPVVTLSF